MKNVKIDFNGSQRPFYQSSETEKAVGATNLY